MTTHFLLGRLQLDFGDWGPTMGRVAITLGQLRWMADGVDVTIEPGYMTDGVTVPRFLWSLLPPWGEKETIAAVFHDYLVEKQHAGTPERGCETRALCDHQFHLILLYLGVHPAKAWLVWLGVRVYSICYEMWGWPK